jgi:predicted nucleic acid-binding protein
VDRLEQLKGQVIGLDTAPFIHYIERRAAHHVRVKPWFAALRAGDIRGVTSMVSLVELLIVPLRRGRVDLVSRYRRLLLRSRNLRTFPIDDTLAERAAELRARHNVRTPDALAAALLAGAAAYLTNDVGLKRVSEIEVLVVDELQGP